MTANTNPELFNISDGVVDRNVNKKWTYKQTTFSHEDRLKIRCATLAFDVSRAAQFQLSHSVQTGPLYAHPVFQRPVHLHIRIADAVALINP